MNGYYELQIINYTNQWTTPTNNFHYGQIKFVQYILKLYTITMFIKYLQLCLQSTSI